MLDPGIREALFLYLDYNYGKHRTFEEVPINTSRADIYAVTERGLIGFEIKSDNDSYTRLSSQVKNYDLYFDCNYLVIGKKHRKGVEKHVPDYWGIITVEQSEGVCDFYVKRKPSKNPKVKWKKKLSILWRPELANIQNINNLPKYRQKSKDFVVNKICLLYTSDAADD